MEEGSWPFLHIMLLSDFWQYGHLPVTRLSQQLFACYIPDVSVDGWHPGRMWSQARKEGTDDWQEH